MSEFVERRQYGEACDMRHCEATGTNKIVLEVRDTTNSIKTRLSVFAAIGGLFGVLAVIGLVTAVQDHKQIQVNTTEITTLRTEVNAILKKGKFE